MDRLTRKRTERKREREFSPPRACIGLLFIAITYC